MLNNYTQYSMDQLLPGQRGIIHHFVSPLDTLSLRLQEMGLVIGTSFKIIRRAFLKDPIEIAFNGCHLTLRKLHAQQIIVIYALLNELTASTHLQKLLKFDQC